MLITSSVSGFNVGADDINMTSPGVIFLDFTQRSSRATEDIIQLVKWPFMKTSEEILKNLAEMGFFFSQRDGSVTPRSAHSWNSYKSS